MSYAITTDDDIAAVVVTTGGELAASEFHAMIADVQRHCVESGLRRVLVDHSAATVRKLAADDVYAIARSCAVLNPELVGGQLAVVLVSDIDYGLGRMWQSYADDQLSYASGVFRSLDDARAWLKADDGDRELGGSSA